MSTLLSLMVALAAPAAKAPVKGAKAAPAKAAPAAAKAPAKAKTDAPAKPAEPEAPATAETSAAMPALNTMCQEMFEAIGGHSAPLTPVGVVPLQLDDPLSIFIADYLVYCLGTQKGLVVLERARLSSLIEELKLDYATGDADALNRLNRLTGAKSIVTVGVQDLQGERMVSTRVTAVDTAQIIASATPVKVESQDLLRLREQVYERKSQLVATGLSAVLPGAGQLYNDEPIKGYSIAGVEAVLIGAAIAFHVIGSGHEDDYNKNRPDTVDSRSEAEDNYELRNIMLWSALGVWALQLLDAATTTPEAPSLESRFKTLPGGAAFELDW